MAAKGKEHDELFMFEGNMSEIDTRKHQRIAHELGKSEGLGISVLTSEGSRRLLELSRAYKRKHGIHWNKDVSDEPWYQAIKDSLFAQEYEGKYWGYGRLHLRSGARRSSRIGDPKKL